MRVRRFSVSVVVYFLPFSLIAYGGDVPFAPPVLIPIGEGGVVDYAIVDVDGDGDLDLILQRSASILPASVVDVLFNIGDLTLAPAVTLNIPVSSVGRMNVGDINLDELPDIIVTEHPDSGPSRVLVLLNDGGGGFSSFIELPGGHGGPSEGRVGDVTGDGWPDIVFVDFVGASVWVYESDGDGGFLPPRITPSGGGLVRPNLADYDGDGDLDLFGIRLFQYPNVMFIENVGGAFTRIHDIVAHFGGESPTADFNNDGLPEIVSGKYGKFRVLENHGGFRFTLSNLIDPVGVFPTPTNNVPGFAPAENTGDFDLDGRPDILGRACSLEPPLNQGLVVVTQIEGPGYGLYPDIAAVGVSDGRIDGTDLAALLIEWGPDPGFDVVDLNDDLEINGHDLARMLASWGVFPEKPPLNAQIIPFAEGSSCFVKHRAIDLDSDGDDDIVVHHNGGFQFFENLLIRRSGSADRCSEPGGTS